jgi:O-antigen/teichoic acid export membrane protein
VVVAILGVLYQEGAVIAMILSLAVMFRFLNFGIGEMLTTGNRQKARVSIEMVMLLTNVALNGLLIPLYGGVGAAVATGIAEIVLFIGAISLCFKYGLFEKGASPGTVNG